uniref:Uncharacterized protein n=1 Tax=Nelumbo nucifera TaxID=4432 RepID=A0A822Y5V5_NELNU|nr:TPA_asm: hypothetical protein HUJ06_028861 [Nelumbo nucifera]
MRVISPPFIQTSLLLGNNAPIACPLTTIIVPVQCCHSPPSLSPCLKAQGTTQLLLKISSSSTETLSVVSEIMQRF